jgi:hypothetical protein
MSNCRSCDELLKQLHKRCGKLEMNIRQLTAKDDEEEGCEECDGTGELMCSTCRGSGEGKQGPVGETTCRACRGGGNVLCGCQEEE